MKGLLRRWIERIEIIIITVLAVLTLIVQALDFLQIPQPAWAPGLSTLLVAAVAAFLVTVVGWRVLEISENVIRIRGAIRPDVAVQRERVYEQSLALLHRLSADSRPLPVRAYVPAGVWIVDSAKRQWFEELAKLVKSGRITFTAVYGTPETEPEFKQMNDLIEGAFAEIEQEWISSRVPKGALFYLLPPSRPKPGVAFLLVGQEAADIGFPSTPGYASLQRGLIIHGQDAVAALVNWFEELVQPSAQPINTTQSIADGFNAFAKTHYEGHSKMESGLAAC